MRHKAWRTRQDFWRGLERLIYIQKVTGSSPVLPTISALDTPSTSIEHILANELSVTSRQVWAAIKLLDGGATVPFIARYRKEATGGLTDTHLRMLSDRLEYLRELESRRVEVLHSIEEQGKLSENLKVLIQKAATKAELEDLYLPFRPKKQSKAQSARDRGLEPLAESLLKNPSLFPEVEALKFLSPDKDVPDIASALSGAKDILAERFSENSVLLGALRNKFWNEGWMVSKKKEIKIQNPEAEKFSDYFGFREAIRSIPSHRVLALLRGRKENILDVTLVTDGYAEFSSDKAGTDAEYIHAVAQHFQVESQKRPSDAWLMAAVIYAWKYKIRIHLEIDLFLKLREKAEEEAIRVFAENLRSLLLAAPAGSRVTMGLDPGFRTGVKVAVVGTAGQVLETAVIYPHPPEERRMDAIKILTGFIKKYQVELVAIGNGTASRETDAFVSDFAKRDPELHFSKVIVSEAGASVYSASALASEELPAMDVSLRGAVSIARRLQDPLAELVKIDPKSIGVGQYQHDVSQFRLGKMLHHVVEDCVNAVGVDVNTASAALLSYVSGLSKRAAENLVQRRNTQGLFKSRLQFLTIPDFGSKTFEQAAGFLRIHGGENPLDISAVHPESYPVVEKILSRTSKSMDELLGNHAILSSLKPEEFMDETVGAPTVRDILLELEKPGRDPRPEFRTAAFREDVTRLEDLKPGMTLEGTVTNVANFGVFVDIGVHQDGLIHISELSDQFVRDPQEVVKTGQVVRVRVLEIDRDRKRISLSMKRGSSKPARV